MLKMTGRMLSNMGCTVVPADSAEKALTLCQEATESFDLPLTDVILPTATGAELGRSVKMLFPDIAVLFVSGYTADVVLSEMDDPGVRFLQKPFILDELRTEIVQAVQESSAIKRLNTSL